MKNIIVAVDDPELRAAVASGLEARGYAASEAPGREAFALAASAALVVADASSDLGPAAFAEELRREAPAVPLLFLTGYGFLSSPADLRALGASYCLRKPFSTPALLRAVEKLAGPPGAAGDEAGLPQPEPQEVWPSASESEKITFRAAAALTGAAVLLAGAGWVLSRLFGG